MGQLERRFQDARAAVVRGARSHGENYVTRTLALMREQGGVAAARQVLAEPASAEPESGLDVDALVVDPAWGCLFTDEEKAVARARLQGRR